jgi:hypothetical protein
LPDIASLQQLQRQFTAHIRNPSAVSAPAGIENRRMKIYNDLIYNNIEGFLSGGFPVLRSLFRDEDWHLLVRDFIVSYRCDSPYFLEISQEFLNYLMQVREPSPVDPPFMLELAHYEWVELALDVSTDEVPSEGVDRDADLLAGVPVLSPLVLSLQYNYPVHLIGPGSEPDDAPAEPTFLVVYRNADDEVKFMESNAATARLLELVGANEAQCSGRELLEQLAQEMNAESVTSVVDFGSRMLQQFHEQDIIPGCRQI